MIYRIVVALTLLTMGGCVSEDLVTTRPSYAFPQRLISLCDAPTKLDVSNVGQFTTADYTHKGNHLLLSAQLLTLHPSLARHVDRVLIEVAANRSLAITAVDSNGRYYEETVPAKRVHCQDGEFILSFDKNSSYFWASVGTYSRELVLWTNVDQSLVLQNRWREVHRGMVGGHVSGDAWARFDASLPSAPSAIEAVQPAHDENCAPLEGQFQVTANVVAGDGTLGTRSASDQFFRDEIVGEEVAARVAGSAARLKLSHPIGGDVAIEVYDENLLATRILPVGSIKCANGQWLYRGDTQLASAWLLFAAGGGVFREDLTLWKDWNGDLLIEGLLSRKGVLFLIPIGNTEKTFMAFPPWEAPGVL
ncbi:MAG: hypothetical protein O3C68_04990 [Proteobacteria bacterium]|nr:hypothetical protein [Pseudomonadota bacterium]